MKVFNPYKQRVLTTKEKNEIKERCKTSFVSFDLLNLIQEKEQIREVILKY